MIHFTSFGIFFVACNQCYYQSVTLFSEDDDFEPVLPAKVDTSRWEDEDKVKQEEALKESIKKPEPAAPKPKTDNSAKPKVKATKHAKEAPKTEEPIDPIAEKLKQQKLVEDTDFQHAQSLFSGIDEQININNPKDEKDFDALAKVIGEKLSTQYGVSIYTFPLMQNFTWRD